MKHFPAEVNLNSPDSLNQFISRSNLNISFRKESFSRNRRNFTFPKLAADLFAEQTQSLALLKIFTGFICWVG